MERSHEVDIVRGFAVMGICFVNVPEMFGKGLWFTAAYTGSDALVRMLYDLLIQTKFYTLFAFLFGLSFWLFMQSAERKGGRPNRPAARRLALLLGFGAAHGVLIWFGDVLFSYALCGFLLLLFYKRQPKTVLAWSISLLTLSALLIAGSALLVALLSPEALNEPTFSAVPGLQERFDYWIGLGLANTAVIVPEILGLFLLGLYAGKKGWFGVARSGDDPRPAGLSTSVLTVALWVSLALSALLMTPIVMEWMSSDAYRPGMTTHFTYLSGKTLAVFYLCALILLVRRFGAERFVGLSAVGRMAFTNYLTQSLITVALLQWVWHNAAEWPLWSYALYSALLLAVQTAWSLWWLRRYRMGPFEWVWRAGTYGKPPAFAQSRGASFHRNGSGCSAGRPDACRVRRCAGGPPLVARQPPPAERFPDGRTAARSAVRYPLRSLPSSDTIASISLMLNRSLLMTMSYMSRKSSYNSALICVDLIAEPVAIRSFVLI